MYVRTYIYMYYVRTYVCTYVCVYACNIHSLEEQTGHKRTFDDDSNRGVRSSERVAGDTLPFALLLSAGHAESQQTVVDIGIAG